MTKIENKLEELGYDGFNNSYSKPCKSAVIHIYLPIDDEEKWLGYIVLIPLAITSEKVIKDLQTAWNILQNDLKEINHKEKR